MRRILLLLSALAAATAPALAQEREWMLDAGDTEAYLIFGVPESDDIGVSLWCHIGKGQVNLFVPRPTAELRPYRKGSVPLKLTAGEASALFAGKVEVNPESATSSVETEIAATHPIIAAIEKADRFTVEVGKETIVFPLYAADVPDLLALCRKS